MGEVVSVVRSLDLCFAEGVQKNDVQTMCAHVSVHTCSVGNIFVHVILVLRVFMMFSYALKLCILFLAILRSSAWWSLGE